MGFTEAVKSVFSNYVTFSGRARRSEYWWFFLFSLIAYFVAGVIDGAMGFGDGGLFSAVVSFGLLLPSLAVLARRLHDIDRSAWWILIYIIPLIGLIVIIVFACTPGTNGANRFGPDPKGGDAAEVF